MEQIVTKKYLDLLTYQIIGSAIDVHKTLGPGMLESIYERCLKHDLRCKGFHISSQQRVPIKYKSFQLECDLRYDLMVNNQIVIEIKSVEKLIPLHEAQLLSYLKLLNKPNGILLNFNCTNIFQYGQKTLVTKLFSELPAE